MDDPIPPFLMTPFLIPLPFLFLIPRSAPAHCGVGGDPYGTLDLGWWFEQMPTDAWKKTL